jgi:glycosyltransferase involved in cell wall biosynthesis
MKEQPRIGFYIPALDLGGAQRVTVNIVNGLVKREYRIDLLLSYRGGELRDSVDDRVNVVDLGTPRIPIVGIGASVPEIQSYLNEREPAVLFSAMTYASVISIVASTLSNAQTKVVGIEHTPLDNRAGLKERLTLRLARHLYQFVDRIIAVSEGVADSVVANTAVSESDVFVLHNPVPVKMIRKESEKTVTHPWIQSDKLEVILWAGRLEPEKDLPTLLEAFASVNQIRSNTRLILAGTGSERQKSLHLSETLGIREMVSFPGYIQNPYAYMRQSSAFVLSSRQEGLPTVLIEALACECPVVSADCPTGPREILADETYGTLVPVGDQRALAEAVLSTLENPPDSAKLTERAGDFSMDVVVDEYVAFLEQVML